jgi:hypothetical protein
VSIGDGGGQDQIPPLPDTFVRVGVFTVFSPIGEEFNKAVTFHIPVKMDLLPKGQKLDEVEVLAFTSDLKTNRSIWKPIPVTSRSKTGVFIKETGVRFYAVVPVVKNNNTVGVLSIFTKEVLPEIYIDSLPLKDGAPGFVRFKAGTPSSVFGLDPGTHQLKAYASGYNEILRTITTHESGDRIDLELVRTGSNPPVIAVDPPVLEEMLVSQGIGTITGRISRFGKEKATKGFMIMSHNGFDTFVQVGPKGIFSHIVPFNKGENLITFRYTSPAGITGVSRTLRIFNLAIESVLKDFSGPREILTIPHPRVSTPEEDQIRKSKLEKNSRSNLETE